MGLTPLRQGDFSAGMYRSVQPQLIPENGAYDLKNALLDIDGAAFRRGGLRRKSAVWADGQLTFIWTGHLAVGKRTLVANGGSFGAEVDDTIVPLGGGGLSRPRRAHVVGDFMVIDGGTVWRGGQARGTSHGLINLTNGSKTVRAGLNPGWAGGLPTWRADAAPGMILQVADHDKTYVVERVISNTILELTEPWGEPTLANAYYRLTPFDLAAYVAPSYSVLGKRLLAFEGSNVHFAEWDDPTNFLPGNVHRIPGGVEILGGDAIRDTAIVFTSGGVWALQNMDLEPFDDFGNVQQRLDLIDPGLVLWAREGIAPFADSLVVPALDGVYTMTPAGERVDVPISPLYRNYIEAGFRPGGAIVHRSHYLLPILDDANKLQDLLVCRLDSKRKPWTRFAGATVTMFAEDRDDNAVLLGAGADAIVEARYFNPDADVPDDHGVPFDFDLIGRAVPTGAGNKNVVRRADVLYELVDTQQNDNPTLTVSYSGGKRVSGSDWGGFDWGQSDWADPDSVGYDTAADTLGEQLELTSGEVMLDGEQRRARFFTVRLRSSGRVAKLVISAITLWTRQSTKAD